MFSEKNLINIKKEKLELLIESVRDGLPVRISCDRASIPQWYYFSWLKIYNDFVSMREKEGKSTKDCEEFNPIPYLDSNGSIVGYYYTPISMIETLKKAYADFIHDTHKTVAMGLKDRWQSAAWLLERRCRNEYSKEESAEEKKSVSAVKVSFVDPKQDKKRLEQLLKEVKENVGRE